MFKKFHQEILKSYKILEKGGIILYPTDTVWGIGCDSRNFKAIQKLYSIKKRSIKKPMILLVNCIEMLLNTVKVPWKAWNLITKISYPLTIIYDYPKYFFSSFLSYDGSLAVRLILDPFCQELIKILKRPLISTSANISGKPTPLSYYEISSDILKKVDYIVDLHKKNKIFYKSPSIILKYDKKENWKILRI